MYNNNKKHLLGRVFLNNNNKVKKNMDNNNKKLPIGCFLIIDFLLDVNVCKGKSWAGKPFLMVRISSKHSKGHF